MGMIKYVIHNMIYPCTESVCFDCIQCSFRIVTNNRTFLLCVASAEDRNDWIQSICGVVSEGENRERRQNSMLFQFRQRSRPSSITSNDPKSSPSIPIAHKSMSSQGQNMLQPAQQIEIMRSSQSMQSIKSVQSNEDFEEKKMEIPEILQSKSDQPSPHLAVSPDPILPQNENVSYDQFMLNMPQDEKQKEFAPLLQQPRALIKDLDNDQAPQSHRIYLLSPYKANKSFVCIPAMSDGMLCEHVCGSCIVVTVSVSVSDFRMDRDGIIVTQESLCMVSGYYHSHTI